MRKLKRCILKKCNKCFLGGEYDKASLSTDFQMSFSLVKICNYNVWIYGAGKNIYSFVKFIKEEGLKVTGIIDRDNKKHGEKIFGVEIISPENFIKKEDKNAYVYVYTRCIDSIDEMRIIKTIQEGNIAGFYIVGGNRKLVTLSTVEWIDDDRLSYYIQHEKEIAQSFSFMEDEESLDTFLEYLRTYVEMSRYRKKEIQTRFKYFYGLDGELLYRHINEEKWLCFGACKGDTIFHYLALGLNAKKIIAIEGDKILATQFEDNMKLLPSSITKNITLINKMVGLDEFSSGILSKEDISLINADIEGAELEMLQIMKDTLIRCRPVIAVCVYHKKEDLVNIPRYINSILSGYIFKLRKYTSFIGNTNRNYELVLYAIPNERNAY